MPDYTEKNCLITVGSTEGLSTFIRTFVAEGDEVIMPLPTYPDMHLILKCKKVLRFILDTSKDGFKLTAKNLESKITLKTKSNYSYISK